MHHFLLICFNNKPLHYEYFIMISDFSQEIYVLPDDDMQCAIETCRSSEIVLMCIILD
jgi:fructose-1,6-bisphosphatase/sedoheptulose 1,7-bisphosphatase-like protein